MRNNKFISGLRVGSSGRLIASATVAAAFGLALGLAPNAAHAQSGAAGAAVAAQEAGIIFSDQRIRDMADRRIRLETISQRIEEIQLLQQLEVVDPVGAREYRAQIFGTVATEGGGGDGFFEQYDKEQRQRGVVLPVLVSVQGSGGNLVAQVQYDGLTTFVRNGQLLDDNLRVVTVETNAIIVDLRGRKFRVPLGGG